MTVSEYMQLKAIAEADGLGGDLVQFHDDAISNFQAYMHEMDAWCRSITRTVEHRINEAAKEGE